MTMTTTQDVIRRLAETESGDLPLLSIYLDMRPDATGQNPQVWSGLIVLRDRLRDIRRTLGVRGDAAESFERDESKINGWVENEMSASSEGVAIFACGGIGLFETFEAETPFENRVRVGNRPDLYQLARLDDEYETSIVAVIDTNTARIFAYRHGRLVERGGPDDDSASYRKRSTGGWSQARYQRHIDKHRKDFGEEMAQSIAEAAEHEGARHIVLAGEETSMRWLREAMEKLPQQVRDLVRGELRIDKRAERDEIHEQVEPLLREIEQQSGEDAVQRVVAEVRQGDMGVCGIAAVRKALEIGQADTVVIDDNAELSDEERAELVRQAALTSARVEIVGGDERFTELGGVGALLRYRV